MKKIKNNFIFFGAIHQDYVFELKNDLIKYRTNPVKHKESYGGVAHNVARMISNHENVSFFSLMSDKETINYLKKNKIDFIPLNKKIEKRYYGVLVNKYKKFELGIANTDAYEKFTKITNLKFLNKYIVLDLNFSEKFIQSVVSQNFKKNHITICGTSLFKINKVKKIIRKINCLILNKEELYSLSKIKNIKKSIMKIINLNPYINIIVSNADKKTWGYETSNFISCKPPNIKPVNENGAGDVMTGTYIYYRSKDYKMNSALSLAVAAGTLYAKSKKRKINLNYKSIKKINNKIISKSEK
ncbi:PfkB family carbohydrate kinase [Alphaproteobacteria bacterium]|nr:PfkB family carbohydrate kinase [Alphaproteobacteria bacterium]